MKINYIISLGKQCHTAQFLKDNKLKKCSYPFDWIFSWHQSHNYGKNHIIVDCLDNHFKIFLNKKYYNGISHEKYGERVFLHRSPISHDGYGYYERCVQRLYMLLKKKERKMFMIINTNNSNKDINLDSIKYLNNILKKYTENFDILVITHKINKKQQYSYGIYDNNIHYFKVCTLSSSNGRRFENDLDNVYLQKIIFDHFDFEILNL